MALRMHLLSPKTPQQTPKFHTSPRPKTLTIQCKKKRSLSDAELASDLSKMTTLFAQRDEAVNKSRQLLFTELCQFLDSKPDEVSKKWRKLGEDDKWALVKGFVSEWGVNFHPLSAKSVKDLVEEHLHQQNPPPKSLLFPGFKRMMGFSEDQ
uniref:uncharacterized protein LOC105349689 n=1 Tax=Fragaria vesca subsp. vesca TaxID=101020 RepID=UPI0005C8E9F4|nr:PREDICTED: uncharacterized protein LOC105349689 [Fragaria vesca subsp. vesca]